MTEILASVGDVNTHLPPNVQIDNSVDDNLQIDAFRLIRGQLVSLFTTTVVNGWSSPENTPEQIRSIAGRLIASKYYSRLVSGDVPEGMADYSVSLYNQAISMLTDIKSGALLVVDVSGNVISTDTGGLDPSADVYPNDTSSPGPQFTMDRVMS